MKYKNKIYLGLFVFIVFLWVFNPLTRIYANINHNSRTYLRTIDITYDWQLEKFVGINHPTVFYQYPIEGYITLHEGNYGGSVKFNINVEEVTLPTWGTLALSIVDVDKFKQEVNDTLQGDSYMGNITVPLHNFDNDTFLGNVEFRFYVINHPQSSKSVTFMDGKYNDNIFSLKSTDTFPIPKSEIGYTSLGWYNNNKITSFDQCNNGDILRAKYMPKNYNITYKY